MDTGYRQFCRALPKLLPGLLGTLLAVAAAAAPPAGRGAMQTLGVADIGAAHLENLRSSPAARILSRLDLRAPANLASPGAEGETHAVMPAAAVPVFPSVRRPSEETLRARLQDDLPALGDGGTAVRVPSRAEEMARRFRREGLPVARLFESRSALVSLGLNQRGKPGIWLIQKIP